MATKAQIEVYRWHKDICIANKIGQTQFFHRKKEGVLTPVVGFPENTDYTQPSPRSIDNPMDAAVLVWMVWIPIKLRGTNLDGGDTEMSRSWIFRSAGQMPAIDDNQNVISVQDDDFGKDPNGIRFKMENPVISPDGSFWTFEFVRVR